MSLTRKMLKAMGIDEEKIDQIIEAHTETTDALKNDLNGFKEKAKQYDEVKKELDELKASPPEDWKEKHDKVKKELDDFKTDLNKKETLSAKKKAYSAILKNLGINDPLVIENAMFKANFDKMELDGENLKDAKQYEDAAKTDYADYIEVEGAKGSNVERPPRNTSGRMTAEEIMAIPDRAERRAAIAKNQDLFTKKEG